MTDRRLLPYEHQLILIRVAECGPCLIEELAERTRHFSPFVRSVLTALSDKDLVFRNGRGEWLLTEAGHDWLDTRRPDDLPKEGARHG